MDFNIRPLNSNDYDNILLGWWKDWGWVAPPKDFLPQNGEGGIIILDGDVPICAGFLYASNSNLCWVDWIISNKQYRKIPFVYVKMEEALLIFNDSKEYGQ